MKHKEKRNIAVRAAPAEDMQWGLVRAKRKGLIAVEPKRNELQIDLDGARALRTYGMQYSILRRSGLTKGWRERVRPSKSGGSHTHVIITMPKPIDNLRRVTFQAVLGSDIKREVYNLCRVINHNRYPIVFFERS
jgi:hypothetical protein